MSRKRDLRGNAIMESFFACFEAEVFYTECAIDDTRGVLL